MFVDLYFRSLLFCDNIWNDFADFSAGNLSESEFEGDQEQVELPQDVSKDTGCRRGETSNVRLYEIGPRLTLQLLKIEEGVDDGEVIFLFTNFVLKKSLKIFNFSF